MTNKIVQRTVQKIMARCDHIPIFQKTYQLTLAVCRATGNLKKEYKYTLGEKLKTICTDMLDLIIIINSAKNKQTPLSELDRKLETLRIHLRLAFDLRVISPGLLGALNKSIDEIGQQIGGWQKWARNHRSGSAPARVPGRPRVPGSEQSAPHQ